MLVGGIQDFHCDGGPQKAARDGTLSGAGLQLWWVLWQPSFNFLLELNGTQCGGQMEQPAYNKEEE